MGQFDLTCAVSGLAITGDENVGVILVAKDSQAWVPVAAPIWGYYDGYGSITTPRLSDVAAAIVAARGMDPTVENLLSFLEDVRQGMLIPELTVRIADRPIGFTMVLAEIFHDIEHGVLATPEGEAFEELEDADLVARAVGVPAVSSAFVTDPLGPLSLGYWGFAVFRHWFDAHRTWAPHDLGSQFTPAELARRVHDARKQLPALAEAIDAYARRVL